MNFIRRLLGLVILTVDYFTRPKPIVREEILQNKINKLTSKMSLYQYRACPFCVKVRRKIRKYSLNIETKDAKKNLKYKDELKSFGGKLKVPCLKIERNKGNDIWLYESNEIIDFLINDLNLDHK